MESYGDQLAWLSAEVLRECLRSRESSIVSEFAAVLNEDDRDILVESVFWQAILAKEWWLAEQCLSRGMSLSPQEGYVDAPLHTAMDHCRDATDVVAWLLDHGAEIERRDWSYANTTPLIRATYLGLLNVVGLLLERGADVNASTGVDDDDTAIIVAAKHGDADLVKLLLAHGALPDRKNRWDQDAASAAQAWGHTHVAQMLADHRGRR